MNPLFLEGLFEEASLRYTGDRQIIRSAWDEIVHSYSASSRHYHNLGHLENVIRHLPLGTLPDADRDILIMVTFYHDLIYDPLRNDNEEKSAEAARRVLKTFPFPEDKLGRVIRIILATKKHDESGDVLSNTFLDADLSILAAHPNQYDEYTRATRREYEAVAGPIYREGRRKVLQHFLAKLHIYKTRSFRDQMEIPARDNIARELQTLQ